MSRRHPFAIVLGVVPLWTGLALHSQPVQGPAKVLPSAVRVPFVGCRSDGQVGPLEAPAGPAPGIELSSSTARRLAYYRAENGVGVLGPRGWHCFSTYGSNGSSLFVTPDAINAASLFSTEWSGFAGPAIQVSVADGDTSGRFQVARVVARVFPDSAQFTRNVIAEGVEPASSFPAGPYPHDRLTYRSRSVVEFETPAKTEGLGTASRLRASSDPIEGVAILISEGETSLVQLSARLPEADRDLMLPILRQLEREAAPTGHP